MNYAEYMRKITNTRSKIIGFQNGQDASQVTLKAGARAQVPSQPLTSSRPPRLTETSFSKIGGTVANIMESTQHANVPTNHCSSGYKGVADGRVNADTTGNLIGAAQHCAVCSDAPSSEPYKVEIPCESFLFIRPYDRNPEDHPKDYKKKENCCAKDMSQLFRDNSELVADQGRQLDLRTRYGLPSKLDSLRGPIVRNR